MRYDAVTHEKQEKCEKLITINKKYKKDAKINALW